MVPSNKEKINELIDDMPQLLLTSAEAIHRTLSVGSLVTSNRSNSSSLYSYKQQHQANATSGHQSSLDKQPVVL